MPKLTVPFPSLIGGVSQQPPALRLPIQSAGSTNAIARAVEGLRKRPPTQHVGLLTSPNTGAAFHHLIDRDDTEKYAVIIQNKTLQVFDILNPGAAISIRDKDDNPATQGAGGDFDYLTTSDPENDIQALTVADYTIVINKSITPVLDAATTASDNPRGLIYCRQGNYTNTYRVEITKGANKWEVKYTTHSSNGNRPNGGLGNVTEAETSIRTSTIINALHTGFTQATIPAPYSTHGSITRSTTASFPITGMVLSAFDHVLELQSSDATDFKAVVSNTEAGSTALVICKDEVQLFSDLPTTGPDGFKIQIKGNPDTNDGSYWVKFNTTNADITTGFGEGQWVETNAPGITYKLNIDKMPHALIRRSDGLFQWTPLTGNSISVGGGFLNVPKWGERSVGDLLTNPDPSFVGTEKGIKGLVFWQNRLGILTHNSLALSETGELFNFFRTTVTDLLDTERIDVTTQHHKIDNLDSAVPLAEKLVLFGSKSQQILRGLGESLTGSSLSLSPASHYDIAPGTLPIAVADSIMAPDTRGVYGSLMEIRDVSEGNNAKLVGIDITSSVPSYINGHITKLTANSTENVVALINDSEPSTIYIYTYYFNGNERAQSAWQKFIISGSNVTIRNLEFVKSDLYLIVERTGTPDEVSVEKIKMEPHVKDDSTNTYQFCLDRRINDTDIVAQGGSISYSAGADETTIQLPYYFGTGSVMQVYTQSGKVLPLTDQFGGTVKVAGDYSSTALWVGESYSMEQELSKPFLQTQNGAPIAASDLRLGMANLLFEDTAYFRIEISRKGGQTTTSTFTGPVLSGGAKFGSVGLSTGRRRFAVLGRAEDVTVKLLNDSPFPSKFLGVDWECSYRNLGGRRFG